MTRRISVYTWEVALSTSSLTYNALHAQISSTAKEYVIFVLTFPTPLMTPPDTSTYFMIAFSALATVWGRERRNLEGRGASQEICSVPHALVQVGHRR